MGLEGVASRQLRVAAAVAGVSVVAMTGASLVGLEGNDSSRFGFMLQGAGIACSVLMAFGVFVFARFRPSERSNWLAAGFAVATLALSARLVLNVAPPGDAQSQLAGIAVLTLLWRVVIPLSVFACLLRFGRWWIWVASAGLAGFVLFVTLLPDVLPASWSTLIEASDHRLIEGLALSGMWGLAALLWIRRTGVRPRADQGWISIALLMGVANQLLWIPRHAVVEDGLESAVLVFGQFALPGIGMALAVGFTATSMAQLNDRLRLANSVMGARLAKLETTVPTQSATAEDAEHVERFINEGDFTIVFQPIVEMQSGQIVGLETLTRFGNPPGRPPDEWFGIAAELGRSRELELAVIDSALEQAFSFDHNLYISINVLTSTLISPQFAAIFDRYRPSQIVVEVTEQDAIDAYELIRAAIESERVRGLRLAIDDLGSGHGGLQHLVGLQPHMIKIDKTLTQRVGEVGPSALIRAVDAFGRAVDATVIAEGVETQDQHMWLTDLGVRFAQGYYYARPLPLPATIDLYRVGHVQPQR